MNKFLELIPTIASILLIVLAVVYFIMRKKIYKQSIVRINNRVEIYEKGVLIHWYYVDTTSQIVNAENANAWNGHE